MGRLLSLWPLPLIRGDGSIRQEQVYVAPCWTQSLVSAAIQIEIPSVLLLKFAPLRFRFKDSALLNKSWVIQSPPGVIPTPLPSQFLKRCTTPDPWPCLSTAKTKPLLTTCDSHYEVDPSAAGNLIHLQVLKDLLALQSIFNTSVRHRTGAAALAGQSAMLKLISFWMCQ